MPLLFGCGPREFNRARRGQTRTEDSPGVVGGGG